MIISRNYFKYHLLCQQSTIILVHLLSGSGRLTYKPCINITMINIVKKSTHVWQLNSTATSIYTRLTASREGHLKSRKRSTDRVQCFTAFDWHSSKHLTKTIYKHQHGSLSWHKLDNPSRQIQYVRPPICYYEPIFTCFFHLQMKWSVNAYNFMQRGLCYIISFNPTPKNKTKQNMLVIYKYLKK